jgi:hypothetical protein
MLIGVRQDGDKLWNMLPVILSGQQFRDLD